jgi:hypothetical protein
MLVAGSVAIATASSSGTTYYACLHKGTLSKVGTSKASCPSGYKLISWNSVGPQGLRGVTGPKGAAGQNGAAGTPGPGERYFTSSGNYQVPAGVTKIKIVVVGAGGGGGGYETNNGNIGGGGGQGAAETVFASVVAGTSLIVTIGAGGSSYPPGVLPCGNGVSFGGQAGGSTKVEDGATVLAIAGGGSGGASGDVCGSGVGGAGGVSVVESGVATLSASNGAPGLGDTEPGTNGAGVHGVDGSGADGGTSSVFEAAAPNGYAEITPVS